jgi:hypothetical protein
MAAGAPSEESRPSSGPGFGLYSEGALKLTIRSTGVLELWSIEKNISGSIQVDKMIGHHLAEFVLLNYFNRAKNYGLSSSKMRFIHLRLNDIQHSSTLTLRHVLTGKANFL